jgi:glutamate-1-semialdehyde 2,1-aminomutase
MKYFITLVTVSLVGCSTPVPVTTRFPEAPAALKEKCEQLKKIEGDKVAITEMMKVIVHNYSLYWECSAKVDGWQDWYIGSTTRNKGVPKEVANLTSTFQFNNVESFKSLINQYSDLACIIMEPMNICFPDPGFLELIRKIATDKNIILIFDETITGFRFSAGGAQELFGIQPDLSTFGKGIANGFPLSAVAGKKEIMNEMENIFFSSTFGGELLSLAAAKVVLQKNLDKRVTPVLHQLGSTLQSGVDQIIDRHDLTSILSTSGHPSWIFLNWKKSIYATESELRTFFMQEMFRRGVIVLNTHNVNTALTKRDLSRILNCYDEVLELISQHLLNGSLRKALEVNPLEPLFKVR